VAAEVVRDLADVAARDPVVAKRAGSDSTGTALALSDERDTGDV